VIRSLLCAFLASVCLAAAGCAEPTGPAAAPGSRPAAVLRAPDVPYEPSPTAVVHAMLKLAKVGPGDVVYDLGCGDGRIVIAAVREYGARGVCVDIDPQRIAEATQNAAKAGVSDRVRFLHQDLFQTDIREATAVMLFLWPSVNLALRPKLLAELEPGTRVVSHWHDMGDWTPEQRITVRVRGRPHPVYFWTIPKR
jgi:SAM-dependent methyltransferase